MTTRIIKFTAPYCTYRTNRCIQGIFRQSCHGFIEGTRFRASQAVRHSFGCKHLFSTYERLRDHEAHAAMPHTRQLFNLGSRQMYNLEQTEGTIVGIYTPAYFGTVSIPGLHFHFQNSDNTIGGHMEYIRFDQLKFEVQEVDRINVALPNVQKFRDIDMKMIQSPSGAGAGGSDKEE